jgi:hypothetical protein
MRSLVCVDSMSRSCIRVIPSHHSESTFPPIHSEPLRVIEFSQFQSSPGSSSSSRICLPSSGCRSPHLRVSRGDCSRTCCARVLCAPGAWGAAPEGLPSESSSSAHTRGWCGMRIAGYQLQHAPCSVAARALLRCSTRHAPLQHAPCSVAARAMLRCSTRVRIARYKRAVACCSIAACSVAARAMVAQPSLNQRGMKHARCGVYNPPRTSPSDGAK